ncbi:MAG: hypothetical protein Q4E73_07320 [Lachnospiraceae bacterium]|nr:hypothetical protein [Lachnospiraceae bacterium]
MTNKEKYKKAFSTLQISDSLSWEVKRMAKLKKRQKMKTVAAFIAACLLISISGSAAYAKNIGGIQRTIQLWFHGDQTDAILDIKNDGTYSIQYSGEDGTVEEQSGGGVAIEGDGSERPLTEEELKEQLDSPEVDYKDDGTIWVYYHDQKIDITDKFDNDDICFVKVTEGKETFYITVSKEGSWGFSGDKYMQPEEIITEPEEPETNSMSLDGEEETYSMNFSSK